MSQHAAPAKVPTGGSLLDRHHFLFRRLHSLTGIIPVGFFVMFHLFTNFQIMIGDFQHEVDWIHSQPALFVMELTIWGAIFFHAGLGIVYTVTGKSNVRNYKYADNWRYTLQRVTGIIALLFIVFHIATLRWRVSLFGFTTPFYANGPNGEPLAVATTANALAHPAVAVAYFVGALSVVYHWVNGLWTAAITWGLTISEAAQRRWGYICIVLGIVLTIFTVGAIAGAMMHKVTDEENRAIEQMMQGAPVDAGNAQPGH